MDVPGESTEGILVIVWNADGGWQHVLMDSLHKVVSPGTYSCKLCQLTYGLAGPKAEWSKFLETIIGEVLIYHRDQFNKSPIAKYFPGIELPVVLIRRSEQWQILLSKAEILELKNLNELLNELKQRNH
jgi:hypothetical protein